MIPFSVVCNEASSRKGLMIDTILGRIAARQSALKWCNFGILVDITT